MKFGLKIPIVLFRAKQDVGVIGCGQFAFSSIGYFLRKYQKNPIRGAYDTNVSNLDTFCHYYQCCAHTEVEQLISDPSVKLLYIASNHATHTEYAVRAIAQNKSVYIEKPLSTSYQQFVQLSKACAQSEGRFFVGYNRPFSSAILTVVELLRNQRLPITLNCFVSGHVLGEDHWYREPQEGTRICGNVGHWIDLAIHLMAQRFIPEELKVSVSCSNPDEPDDNLSLTITSDFGDLVVIVLTARGEPFEGINETINIQFGDVIAKIDDFREMKLWQGDLVSRKRYFPKDVGHRNAILQPYASMERNWQEVETSTLLMLKITEMVKTSNSEMTFNISKERDALLRAVAAE